MHQDFQEDPLPPPTPDSDRPKSAQRLRYEAEISLFKRRFGNLEETRKKLALSRRRMCQLLLVDPSAWTRWTRDEAKVPPHIYRALEWYLLLEERYPEVARLMAYQAARSGDAAEDETLKLRIARLEQRSQKEWLKLALAFTLGAILATLTVSLKM